MAKPIFYNPATDFTYVWHVGYEGQEGPARISNTSYDAQASSLGLIATEGEPSPMELTLTGRIIHRVQYLRLLQFFQIPNTFRYTDEEGNEFEVTMSAFEPTKRRVYWNPADANMRHHIWDYRMRLRVLRIMDDNYYEGFITP